MSHIDQFESAFNSALKEAFNFERPRLGKVLVVTDRPTEGTQEITKAVRDFLGESKTGDAFQFDTLGAGDYDSVQSLLDLVKARQPSIITTYRHLHSNAWQWPYGLGEHLDVLTQATDFPVLVLPHPETPSWQQDNLEDTDRVMAVTDHLTGDDKLVNYAAALTTGGGQLYLTHIEDAYTYERYVETISRIPDLDTEVAREQLKAQLLKEPTDFILSCQEILQAHRPDLSVDKVVSLGKRIKDYRRLIDEYAVDLLVMNTKDEDQHAMHGMAHPLAVELRETPLLLL